MVSAPSIQSFESRLDKAWTNLPIKYDIYSYSHTIDKKLMDTNMCMRANSNVSNTDLTLEAMQA